MNPELSVIIVNYNGKRYLKECLDSLYEKLSGISFEIIMLDNASADDSLEYTKVNFPEVILLASDKNLGFGKGNNEAVKHAKGKYLLLINNDTIVLDALLPAIEYLESNQKIGVVGINMLDADGKYLQVAGKLPDVSTMFQQKNLLRLGAEFETGNFSKSAYEVGWLGGSFLLLPKSVFEKVGGFDEDYFMYVEDVDLCKKISDMGLDRIFMPGMRYIHFVGFNKSRNAMLVKGYRIYLRKHASGLKKWLWRAVLELNMAVKSIKQASGS